MTGRVRVMIRTIIWSYVKRLVACPFFIKENSILDRMGTFSRLSSYNTNRKLQLATIPTYGNPVVWTLYFYQRVDHSMLGAFLPLSLELR